MFAFKSAFSDQYQRNGGNFATFRQASSSMLLARWHKRNRLTRATSKTVTLLLAGILALTGPLPGNTSQKVALPNGEVLHFGSRGGLKPRHSTNIMQKEQGPGSVAWHILAGTPTIIWDSGDKEVVANWMRSNAGQAVINKWMTKGDTHGTVFHNADVVLKNYFGASR